MPVLHSTPPNERIGFGNFSCGALRTFLRRIVQIEPIFARRSPSSETCYPSHRLSIRIQWRFIFPSCANLPAIISYIFTIFPSGKSSPEIAWKPFAIKCITTFVLDKKMWPRKFSVLPLGITQVPNFYQRGRIRIFGNLEKARGCRILTFDIKYVFLLSLKTSANFYLIFLSC